MFDLTKPIDPEQHVRIFGIDPGLVTTGVVNLDILPGARIIKVEALALLGDDVDGAMNFLQGKTLITSPLRIFIEKYRPRSNFSTDSDMIKLVATIS